MRYRFIVAALVYAGMAGCVSIHQVDTVNADEWVPIVREQFLGELVDVTTLDGRTTEGKLVHLTADSLRLWRDKTFEEPIGRISYIGRSPGAGTAVGAGFGGLFLGSLLGFVIGEPNTASFGMVGAMNGAMIGGLVGTAAGIIVGAEASRVHQYQITHSGQPVAQRSNQGSAQPNQRDIPAN